MIKSFRIILFSLCLFYRLDVVAIPCTAMEVNDDYSALYSSISDFKDPSPQDWARIQQYLRRDDRDYLRWIHPHYVKLAREIVLYGNKPWQKPQEGVEYVNCDEHYHENCVILYSSMNLNYPSGVRRLVKNLKKSDFVGHILWKIGGWPNLSHDGLRVVHVPYAFKPCFFMEAFHKGYKRVLWLDASAVLLTSINRIFEVIKDQGYFLMPGGGTVDQWITDAVAAGLKVPRNICHDHRQFRTGVVGFDLTNSLGRNITMKWYEAAKTTLAFCSDRPEQIPLSIIAYSEGVPRWEESPQNPDRVSLEEGTRTKEGMFI